MSEGKKNQDQNAKVEQIPSDETQTKYRKISDNELWNIFEDHKKWLESDTKKGRRAELPDYDLSGKIFEKTDLSQAFFDRASLEKSDLTNLTLQKTIFNDTNLKSAIFSNTDLKGASFEKAVLIEGKLIKAKLQNTIFKSANLKNANLSGSELNGAILYSANMQNTVLDGVKGLSEATLNYANMEGATGLLGNEFSQADVTGTKLPDGIKEFKALEIVKETSQNARKIFFAMLLGCVYSWLTIATTTDVRLLTNTASSPLPIIGTEIPIAWFYIAAPLVIICIYFYFHLYLLKLWESLAGLPAKFPDGKRLDERAYPWLLNGLVRRHFRILKAERPFIAHTQEWITIFLAWWVVPITMVAFWLRYIPRHDWFGTCFHISLIVISIAFAIIFYRLCALILKGKKKLDFRLKIFFCDRRFYYAVSVAVVAAIFSLLSYGVIEGIRPPSKFSSRKVNYSSVKEIIPLGFQIIGYDVFADFREREVSKRPINYWEIEKDARIESVKGANLRNRNLIYADMYNAFLVKADLRGASLNGANIGKTNLKLSNLKGAEFQVANLAEANLQNTNLEYTYLNKAILEKADFYEANLKGANLELANLKNANLENANLEGANLIQANLEGADFNLTWFEGANMQEVNLRNAKNIWIGRICKAKTLYKAKIDSKYLNLIKENCPHILEKPKEENEQNK